MMNSIAWPLGESFEKTLIYEKFDVSTFYELRVLRVVSILMILVIFPSCEHLILGLAFINIVMIMMGIPEKVQERIKSIPNHLKKIWTFVQFVGILPANALNLKIILLIANNSAGKN